MAKKAYELLALAHEYYQSPLQHQDWTGSNRLPDEDISQLLEILNESGKNPTLLNEISSSLGTTVVKLRYASLFFIKRLLFSGTRDFYQVLGIPRNATPNLIKKQYRLLIGLFHPDKNPDGEQWQHEYAPLINEAYGTLKKPESRAAYDRRIKASSKTVTSSNHHEKKTSNHSSPKNHQWLWVKQVPKLLFEIPGLYRFPKLTIWSVTLFIVITFLLYSHFQGKVDFLKLPEDQITAQQSPNRTKKNLPIPAELNSMHDQSYPDSDLLEQTLNSTDLKKLLSDDGVPIENSLEPTTKITPDMSLDYITQPADSFEKGSHQAKAEQITKDTDRIPLTSSMPIMPDTSSQHSATTNSLQDSDIQRVRKDITAESIFMQYIKGYEAGDINQLLRLFSPDVIINKGQGRRLAEERYRQLFENTNNRKLIVKEIFIQPQSAYETRIVSDVEIVVLRKNENISRTYVGQLFLRIVPVQQQLQIMQVIHNVKRKKDS